jgi:UDP-glucose 4-epimerase
MGNILIVGGSGFIGQHTARCLASAGHTVWATHSPGKTPPASDKVRWLGVDLAGPNIAADWPTRCDSVVFLAQSRNWRNFPDGAEEVFAINLAALHQTTLYATRCGAKNLLVASTGSVYPDQNAPACETDLIDSGATRSFYAASKLAAEILLGPYRQELCIVQLRIFMPYGPGLNRDMLFSQLIRRVQTGQPIQLHGQEGMGVNPVAVADVAETFRRCLTLDRSETLNVAGPDVVTLREVGETIGNVLNLTPRFEVQPDVKVPVLVGDVSRLRNVLGWTPRTSLEVGLHSWLQTKPTSSAA